MFSRHSTSPPGFFRGDPPVPRKADDDCLMELRWIYDRHDAEEACYPDVS
jgi:hypothetical protein